MTTLPSRATLYAPPCPAFRNGIRGRREDHREMRPWHVLRRRKNPQWEVIRGSSGGAGQRARGAQLANGLPWVIMGKRGTLTPDDFEVPGECALTHRIIWCTQDPGEVISFQGNMRALHLPYKLWCYRCGRFVARAQNRVAVLCADCIDYYSEQAEYEGREPIIPDVESPSPAPEGFTG